MSADIRPQIQEIEEESEVGEIAEVFADVKQVYGLPDTPPLYKSMANSPTVLAGTWNLNMDIMERGELPASLKQLIFLSVSSARGCEYCELVYSALCKVGGISGEQIQAAARDLDALHPTRIRDVVTFAVKVATDVKSVTDEDYALLREHGLGESELLEVIATAATATYFNVLADGMRVDVDKTIRSVLAT